MAIAFRGRLTGNQAPVYGTWVGAPVAGDLLLAFARSTDTFFVNSSGPITASGWVTQATVTDAAQGGSLSVLTKKALGTSADTGNFTDSGSGSGADVVILALSGADTTTPIDGTITTAAPVGSGSTVAAPAVTLTTATSWVVSSAANAASALTTWTASAPLTLDAQISDTGGSQATLAVGHQVPGAIGVAGPYTFTASVTNTPRLAITVGINQTAPIVIPATAGTGSGYDYTQAQQAAEIRAYLYRLRRDDDDFIFAG